MDHNSICNHIILIFRIVKNEYNICMEKLKSMVSKKGPSEPQELKFQPFWAIVNVS